ncbi:hypothetical protein RD792_006842, partial [Penstemon davidsonii]
MAFYLQLSRYSCPICSKSICDMSNVWRKLDEEVASTHMPEMYKNKMVWILCNDCETTSEDVKYVMFPSVSDFVFSFVFDFVWAPFDWYMDPMPTWTARAGGIVTVTHRSGLTIQVERNTGG